VVLRRKIDSCKLKKRIEFKLCFQNFIWSCPTLSFPNNDVPQKKKNKVNSKIELIREKSLFLSIKSFSNYPFEFQIAPHWESLTKSKLCCDRKARAACAQSFALWQQATETTRRDHSTRTLDIMFNHSQVNIGRAYTPRLLYCCLFAPLIYGCCSSRTSRLWWIAHSTQRQPRDCNGCNQKN